MEPLRVERSPYRCIDVILIRVLIRVLFCGRNTKTNMRRTGHNSWGNSSSGSSRWDSNSLVNNNLDNNSWDSNSLGNNSWDNSSSGSK